MKAFALFNFTGVFLELPGELGIGYNLAMVGDRLYTDIATARRAGTPGVLVLTGETTAAEAAKASPPADLIVSTLKELGERLCAPREEIASA